MRMLALSSLLLFAFACTDANMVQPEPDPSVNPALSADPFSNVHGGMEFTAQMVFVGTVNPADLHITPSDVWHGSGLANEFQLTGDIEGLGYFQGDYHINTNNGKGRSISQPSLTVIEGSTWGMTGTFVCNNTSRIQDFSLTDPETMMQAGNMTGCLGTGDFEGMRMNVRLSNEANPGNGGAEVTFYDFWGVIW